MSTNTSSMSVQEFQEFQIVSTGDRSGETFQIPTELDPEHNVRIVRLAEVKNNIGNYARITIGGVRVLPMEDRNGDIILPERIQFQAHIIMHVMLQDAPAENTDHSGSESATQSTVTPPHSPSQRRRSVSNTLTESQLVTPLSPPYSPQSEESQQPRSLNGTVSLENYTTRDIAIQTMHMCRNINSQLENLTRQNYELHEFTIPRLFIILPDPEGNKYGGFITKKYRLFFLCECGRHTQKDKIHVANHEGYVVRNPNEFFKTYRNHILNTLKVFKYAIMGASFLVPALGLMGTFNDLEDAYSLYFAVGAVRDAAIPVLDSAINNTEQFQSRFGDDNFDYKALVALEGAALRNLSSFLKKVDEDQALGNLYRMTTEEGHVEWVCLDHYNEVYREEISQPLKDFVEFHGGRFLQQSGKIVISISSKKIAESLYERMAEAGGILELEISLKWEVSKEDLQRLAKAISVTNIRNLIIDGGNSMDPSTHWPDQHHGERYDPIVRLMSKESIHSMEFRKLSGFFDHVSSAALKYAPRLRMLTIETEFANKGPSKRNSNEESDTYRRILKDLSRLASSFIDASSLEPPNQQVFNQHISDDGAIVVSLQLKPYKIDIIKAEITETKPSSELETHRKIRLTKLSILPTSILQETKKVLETIIRRNRELSEINIEYHSTIAFSLLKGIQETLMKLFSNDSRSLAKVQLSISARSSWHELADPATQDSWVTTLDFRKGVEKFKISTKVGLPCLERYVKAQEHMVGGRGDSVAETLTRGRLELYGSSIEELRTNSTFYDDLATPLENGTEKSVLKFLTLNPGLPFVIDNHQFRQHGLLAKLGDSLKELTMRGDDPSAWLTDMAEIYQSRVDPPNTEELPPSCFNGPEKNNRALVHEKSVHWIKKVMSSSEPNLFRPLARVGIEYLGFEHSHWILIIKALDMTALQELSLEYSNFSLVEFEVLADRILEERIALPKLTLKLQGTELANECDTEKLSDLIVKLREKVSCLKVMGLEQVKVENYEYQAAHVI